VQGGRGVRAAGTCTGARGDQPTLPLRWQEGTGASERPL